MTVTKVAFKVMDFSQAERNGKRAAFIRFWLEEPSNARTREELEEAYKSIPRGCHQHFRSAVTRVKKFLAVDRNTRREVIEDRQEEFHRLTHQLLKQTTAEGFLSVSKSIKESFPRSKPWIEWWERPDRVNMLVVPDGDIRSTVPDSTNAQEAAHAAMYTKHGKDHEVLTGIEKLLLISKEFERLWMLESVGALGEGKTDLERRQEAQEKWGQTKKSRTTAAINEREKRRRLPVTDARPPDTIRTLLAQSGRKRKRQPSEKPSVTRNKRSQTRSEAEDSSDSDAPLANLQQISPKLPASYPSKTTTVTPRRRNRRGTSLNLVSSPIRPVKSPLVKRIRSGHDLRPGNLNSSPKKVTFDDVIGHTIPSRSTTVVTNSDRHIRTDYNTETQPNGDLWLFITSGVDKLIGHKWGNRSCWLDSPLECMFWTTGRTVKSLETIAAMEGGSDLGITTILRIISARRLKLLSNTPNDMMDQELASTKLILRKYLVLEHDGLPKNWTNFSSLDKDDNDLGWLAAALEYIPHKLANQPLSPAQIALQHHFCLWVLRYRFCSRGEPIPDDQGSQPWGHYSIQSVSRDYPIPNLYIRDHQRYRGEFQRYLSARMEVGGVGTPIACWRSVDGNVLCTGRDGDSQSFEPVISLPQILIARVDTSDTTPLNSEFTNWNFPHLVYPYGSNSSAKKAGVVYELVARLFYNGGHYIARFTAVTNTPTRRRAVFSYDGMRNNGFSTREAKGGVAKLLGGSAVENLPPGYYTSGVFYVLQGGKSAQDWVWNRQTEALKSMVGVVLANSAEKARGMEPTFRKQGYSEVPLNDQFWLSAEQKSGREVHNRKREYEAPPTNSSANKFDTTKSVSEGTSSQAIHDHHHPDRPAFEHHKPGHPVASPISSNDGNESLISMDRPPSSSSRGSVVPFQCRCGETEDGDRQKIKQKIIQCEAPGCETWHHVACQLGGEREISSPFYCHMCNGDLPGFLGNHWKQKFLKKLKESIQKGETYLVKNIKSRLQRGIMILVHDGLFYYPARLIEPVSGSYWRVKLWRGNVPGPGASHEPGEYTEVHIQQIVDALSNNVAGRRAIRIGRFMTTRESNELESKQEYPTPIESRRYTTEIDRILSPHTEALQKLIFSPEECDLSDYPSLQYQKKQKIRIVPLTGGLPPTTRSRVMNWMYNVIPGLREREDHTWVTDGGLQEALMRLIAHRDEREFSTLKDCPKEGLERDEFIRARAWERLDQFTGLTQDGRPQPVVEDVDRQALTLLEDAMFSPDLNPGPAGNQQWGLDVGIHQDNWDPYSYFPDGQGKVYHVWDNEEVGKKYREDRYTLTWFELNQKNQEEKSRNDAENQRRTRPRAIPRYKSKSS